MSVINDAINQVANMMRTIPGLTVYVEQEPPGVDPIAPACALDISALSVEFQDYGGRMRAVVSTEWAVRTSTDTTQPPLETSLDMIESVVSVFAEDNFPPGPICSLNVTASLGDARDPGSNYTEPTVSINFFVIIERP